MKFLILSDLHSNNFILEKIDKIIKNENPEKIIVCGDFTNPYKEDFLFSFFKKINLELFSIAGNNDTFKAINILKEKSTYIHKKRIDFDFFNLIGFGGSNPTPFNTPFEFSEDEIYNNLKNLSIDENSILITHTPPYGFFDKIENEFHVGSKSIKKIIKEKKPKAVICGHIHEHSGIKTEDNCKILKVKGFNFGYYAILKIDKKNISFINKKINF